MDFDDDRIDKFVTNVGLVTSNGPHGHNIMACEWTHQVSYSPGMIAVCINHDAATHANIKSTKEFGVCLASTEQTALCSVSGNTSKKKTNKIQLLEKLGFSFYPAEKINALLVKNAALCIECKLVQAIELGDHTMFVGEVLAAIATEKEPIALHAGKYWKLTKQMPKPSLKKREKVKKLIEQFTE